MSIPDLNPRRAATSSSSSLRIAAGGPATAAATTTAVEDSDEDLFTVPDVESTGQSGLKAGGGGAAAAADSTSGAQQSIAGGVGSGTPRKSRNPADREYRKHKRLLRNRVSAQQARERKKMYVNELESRAKDLELKNSSLQEKISTLVNENNMLRKVLMNTRPKVDEESAGNPYNDQSGSNLIQ